MIENNLFGSRPETLMGIRVIPSALVQPVPKIQVRDIKLRDGMSILSPEFRAETNRWLLERFGTKEVAYMFQMGRHGDTIVMNPKQIAMLKNVSG